MLYLQANTLRERDLPDILVIYKLHRRHDDEQKNRSSDNRPIRGY